MGQTVKFTAEDIEKIPAPVSSHGVQFSAADIEPVSSHEPSLIDRAGDALESAAHAAEDFVLGGVYRSGVGRTLYNVARGALMAVPGDQYTLPAELAALQPRNAAERAGQLTENVAEFFAPAGLVRKGASAVGAVAPRLQGAATLLGDAASAAGVTTAQGGTATDAGTAAALTAVVPGAGAMRRAGKALSNQAEPLVRAAIKPTIASLRRITGAGGLDAKANQLVRFIIDNRLTTPDKARALFQRAENELQGVLAVKSQPTDAATRAQRYLEALERSAAKQGLPADDIAQINKAAAELLEGPMGRDVVTMVPVPHPTLLGPNGQPITVMRPQVSRELRASVPASEALNSARSSSRWSTNKAWGEQKGTMTEATKAVERAQRDAAKAAVPEAAGLLRTEAQAIRAEETLDRMMQRAGNRDAASLPAHVIAAGEIASGRVPVMAFAANWLRNNYMKAGIYADALGQAIEKGNAPLVADILKRLGVSASQVMRPEMVPVPAH